MLCGYKSWSWHLGPKLLDVLVHSFACWGNAYKDVKYWSRKIPCWRGGLFFVFSHFRQISSGFRDLLKVSMHQLSRIANSDLMVMPWMSKTRQLRSCSILRLHYKGNPSANDHSCCGKTPFCYSEVLLLYFPCLARPLWTWPRAQDTW